MEELKENIHVVEMGLTFVGCSFGQKQRKAIERKNGRVTPWNRPGTEELRKSQKTEDPFSFTLYSRFCYFYCTITRI